MNKRASILIVDDEPYIQNLLVTYLSPLYTCTVASNVRESLEVLQDQRFDLALVDEGLPDSTGLLLCYYLGQTSPNTVVIVISGKTDDQSIERAKRMYVYQYICKPFHLEDVSRIIEQALQEHPRAGARITA